MTRERRRFSRIPFNIEIEVAVDKGLFRSGTVLNLSIGGCLLKMSADLIPGTPCGVRFMLGQEGTGPELAMDGTIVRSQPGTVAIRFTAIDPEGLFHLQNLIRYNSQDPDMVDDEIRNHPGLR